MEDLLDTFTPWLPSPECYFHHLKIQWKEQKSIYSLDFLADEQTNTYFPSVHLTFRSHSSKHMELCVDLHLEALASLSDIMDYQSEAEISSMLQTPLICSCRSVIKSHVWHLNLTDTHIYGFRLVSTAVVVCITLIEMLPLKGNFLTAKWVNSLDSSSLQSLYWYDPVGSDFKSKLSLKIKSQG